MHNVVIESCERTPNDEQNRTQRMLETREQSCEHKWLGGDEKRWGCWSVKDGGGSRRNKSEARQPCLANETS